MVVKIYIVQANKVNVNAVQIDIVREIAYALLLLGFVLA